MKKETKFNGNHVTLRDSIYEKCMRLEAEEKIEFGTTQMIKAMGAAYEAVVEHGPDMAEEEVNEHIRACYECQEGESKRPYIFGLDAVLNEAEAAEIYAWHEVNLDMAIGGIEDDEDDETLLEVVQNDWYRKTVLLRRAVDSAIFIQTVRYREFLTLKKEEGFGVAWEQWRGCKIVYDFLVKIINGLLKELE